jgi:hypothetical protein
MPHPGMSVHSLSRQRESRRYAFPIQTCRSQPATQFMRGMPQLLV